MQQINHNTRHIKSVNKHNSEHFYKKASKILNFSQHSSQPQHCDVHLCLVCTHTGIYMHPHSWETGLPSWHNIHFYLPPEMWVYVCPCCSPQPAGIGAKCPSGFHTHESPSTFALCNFLHVSQTKKYSRTCVTLFKLTLFMIEKSQANGWLLFNLAGGQLPLLWVNTVISTPGSPSHTSNFQAFEHVCSWTFGFRNGFFYHFPTAINYLWVWIF